MVRFLLLCAVLGVVAGLVVSAVHPRVPEDPRKITQPVVLAATESDAAKQRSPVHPQDESFDYSQGRSPNEVHAGSGVSEAVTNYRVPILTYHYIGGNPNPTDRMRNTLSVEPQIFAQHMEYLVKEGYTTISLDTFGAVMQGKAAMPGKPIILTFDDGYIDFYLNAYQILKKYHLSATVFIPTGKVGTPSYMTWDQIQEIQKDGLIQFEAHSVTHRDLTTLMSEELKNEIIQSKVDLEKRLGTIVNWFAYPYGKSNKAVVNEVRNTGFVGAVTTIDGVYHTNENLYLLKRRNMSGTNPGTNSLDVFRTRL